MAKVTMTVIIVASVGGGAWLIQQWRSAPSGSATVAQTSPPSPPVAQNTSPAGPARVVGFVKTPASKPLAGVEVLLSTVSDKVAVYSDSAGRVASTVTREDGGFSFPSDPANRAVIVMSEAGYGQATVAELAGQTVLMVQPWARVEGVLREGTVPQVNQTIHLSRTRFGSKIQEQAYRTTHDTTTKTDGSGYYSFPRVAPGDTWISWRKNGYDVQYRYFDLRPGQLIIADIGGRGQPVTGRAVLVDSDEPAKFYGSVWPKTPHQMRRPPDWQTLSAEEQDAFTAEWEQTPDAKIYNQERCPIDFRLAPDGTFTVPDLPTGAYRVVVASWTGAPVKSRLVARGQGEVRIGDLPGGRSDQALDMGEVKAYYVAPLSPGDLAPVFPATTLEGVAVKLSDLHGKYVLLHFWRSDVPPSLEELPSLKAAQSAWAQDERLMLLGLTDTDVAAARKFATENGLSWAQWTVKKENDLPMRYRLRRPTAILVGPDGRIVQADLHGSAIAEALAEVLGQK